MTVTLPLGAVLALAALSMLWGVIVGAALMFDVMRDRTPPTPIHIDPPHRRMGTVGPFIVDTAPLRLWSDDEAARHMPAVRYARFEREIRTLQALGEAAVPFR